MNRLTLLLLAGFVLTCLPACSGGGLDSRNKDLDRPKAADEKPVTPPKK
jgi:hypothetical protein